MVAEAFASGAHRRARSNLLWPWTHARLRANCGRRGVRQARYRFSTDIFPSGQELSARLRTVRRRFSLAVSRRGRCDAPRAFAERIRQLVERIFAADSRDPCTE